VKSDLAGLSFLLVMGFGVIIDGGELFWDRLSKETIIGSLTSRS